MLLSFICSLVSFFSFSCYLHVYSYSYCICSLYIPFIAQTTVNKEYIYNHLFDFLQISYRFGIALKYIMAMTFVGSELSFGSLNSLMLAVAKRSAIFVKSFR